MIRIAIERGKTLVGFYFIINIEGFVNRTLVQSYQKFRAAFEPKKWRMILRMSPESRGLERHASSKTGDVGRPRLTKLWRN
jgi:hypothetical protein